MDRPTRSQQLRLVLIVLLGGLAGGLAFCLIPSVPMDVRPFFFILICIGAFHGAVVESHLRGAYTFRFSLQTLFVLTTAIAVMLGLAMYMAGLTDAQ
jgi:hypothetical protein